MANALFISEDYVKRNSVIDENADVKLILPSIKDAQDMFLHPCLGTQLYNGLKNRIVAGTTTADEDTLISDFIAPMLVKYVQLELVDNLLIRFRNKNVSKKNSDNSQPLGYAEYQNQLDRYTHKAQWFKQRLIDYLCANNDLFPEYNTAENSNDLLPESNAYTCSMYLGSEYDVSCYDRYYLFSKDAED